MQSIKYDAAELVLLCEEYKAAAEDDRLDKLDKLRSEIRRAVSSIGARSRESRLDSVFFAGELNENAGEKETQLPPAVLAYRERRASRTAKRRKTAHADSAWDEWLEENLDQFQNDADQIAFKKFLGKDADKKDVATIDLIFKTWRQAHDIRSRKDAVDDDTQWITVKGTHIPLDDDGDMTGRVAAKIKATSDKVKDHLTESGAPSSDDDMEQQGYKKNAEGHWVTKVSGCKTKKDLYEALEERGISVGDRVTDDYAPTLSRLLTPIDDLSSDYPEILEHIKEVDLEDGYNGGEYADKKITFAEEMILDEKDFEHTCKKHAKSGYWPKNSTPEGRGCHELAHGLERMVAFLDPKAANEAQSKYSFLEGDHAKTVVTKAIKAVRKSRPDAKPSELKGEISEYAKRSPSETLAEAFADCFDNRDRASDLSKAIKSEFDSLYRHFKKSRGDGGPGSGNFGHKGVPGRVGGSAPSDSSSAATPASKSKKDFLPTDSYTDTPAFQKAHKAAKESHEKSTAAYQRVKQIDEELKAESKPKPKKEWDDIDELDDLLGRRPMTLTEKGKELQTERKRLYDEMRQYDHDFSEAGDTMRELKREARKQELKDYHPEPLKPAQSDDYEGFTLKETSNSYGDEFLHNGLGVICEMSPKEYLERCAFEIFDEGTMESCVGAIDEDISRKYADQMKQGIKFHLPYLNYKQSGQEGRHRAYAAYLAGIEKMPVLIIGRPRREDSANAYHKRAETKRTDEEEEEGGSHGNTRIPYGLCLREGISVQPGWTPRDAWNALGEKGYDVGSVYRELKATGKIAPRAPKAPAYKRPAAQEKTMARIARKTANLKREQYRIVDTDGNVVLENKGDRHSVPSTVGEKREHLRGNASIHNHPDGGTFSADDLRDFGYGAREIAVSSPEGEYSLVNAKYGTKEQSEGWVKMQHALLAQIPQVSGLKLLQQARANLENCEERKQIDAITAEFSRRKEGGASLAELRAWLSGTEYDALQQAYKSKLNAEQRRLEVEPYHSFYQKNAEKYGFQYSFTPAERKRRDAADSAIEAFRQRRQRRLDAKADEEGRWITTENGHKVHINEEDVPDKGNPRVLAAMRGEGKPAQKAAKSTPVTKKRLNADVDAINDSSDDDEKKREKIREVLEKLPTGSKVAFPASWNNDDGSRTTAVWDGNGWAANGGWSRKNGWNCSMDEMLGYFVNSDPEERPKISSVAQSEEKRTQRAQERDRKRDKYCQKSNGSGPEGYRKAYPSEADYQKAKAAAADLFDKKRAAIDADLKEKEAALDEKYESFTARRLALRADKTLTEEQREQKLQEVEDDRHKRNLEKAALEKEHWEAYNKARTEWQSTLDLDYEFPAKDHEWTMRDDVRAVNPQFISFQQEYMKNCVHCGFAWELRCRGYDVEAEPGLGETASSAIFRDVFKESEIVDVPGGHEGTLAIVRQMREWGDGARAIISTARGSSGHCYNVMNRGGTIVFVDAQCASLWDTDDHGDAIDGGNIEGSACAELFRVDQSRVYRVPDKWVKSR